MFCWMKGCSVYFHTQNMLEYKCSDRNDTFALHCNFKEVHFSTIWAMRAQSASKCALKCETVLSSALWSKLICYSHFINLIQVSFSVPWFSNICTSFHLSQFFTNLSMRDKLGERRNNAAGKKGSGEIRGVSQSVSIAYISLDSWNSILSPQTAGWIQ